MTSFVVTGIEHGLTGRRDEPTRIRGALRVRDGTITAIGDLTPQQGERVVDASGCVVTPGLVNTHHHLFQGLMKSIPSTLQHGLDQWLMEGPYRYWPLVDEETMRLSVTVGLAELMLAGATTVFDHHYLFSPHFDYDPAEVLVETARRFGLRFVLGRGGMTRARSWHRADIPPAPTETLDQLLAGIEEAAHRWHDPSGTATTKVAAAPVTTVFNLGDGEAREIARVARSLGLPLHTHLSENETYVRTTLDRCGLRPVPWMAEQEWLGPDVWLAHLVACDHDELTALAREGTAMAHCPQSNARLGSGVAPAPALHALGGIVSLAVDGVAANEAGDLGQTLYCAFTLHRAVGGPDATRAEDVLHWATAGGAAALGFDGVGTLEEGQAADLVLFELDHPRYFGHHDPAVAPVISGGQLSVRRSFVAGRELVVDGRIPGLDLAVLGVDSARAVARLRSAVT